MFFRKTAYSNCVFEFMIQVQIAIEVTNMQSFSKFSAATMLALALTAGASLSGVPAVAATHGRPPAARCLPAACAP